MARLFTLREAELFRTAVNLAVEVDELRLDAGVPPRPRITIAQQLAAGLSFAVDEDDIEEACEEIRGS